LEKNLTKKSYNGIELLKEVTQKHNIHFSDIIAEASIWANPLVYEKLLEIQGSGIWFPNTRRYKPGQNEKRGQIINEVKLDDNTYANNAIKRAIGVNRSDIIGFETCHIWADTCYNPKYHTLIPNLVLIPRAIASLTDHDTEIQQALQYRSYELYKWYPSESKTPVKPKYYPIIWKEPESYSKDIENSLIKRLSNSVDSKDYASKDKAQNNHIFSDIMNNKEKEMLFDRIKRWSRNSTLIVHKTIAIVNKDENLSRDILVQKIKKHTNNKNAYGTVGSLMTSKGNAYGRIFIEEKGYIKFHPDIYPEIKKYKWNLLA
jgi:hypothetical protein